VRSHSVWFRKPLLKHHAPIFNPPPPPPHHHHHHHHICRYSCDTCGKGFVRRCDLVTHDVRKHGVDVTGGDVDSKDDVFDPRPSNYASRGGTSSKMVAPATVNMTNYPSYTYPTSSSSSSAGAAAVPNFPFQFPMVPVPPPTASSMSHPMHSMPMSGSSYPAYPMWDMSPHMDYFSPAYSMSSAMPPPLREASVRERSAWSDCTCAIGEACTCECGSKTGSEWGDDMNSVLTN
jgi:hypothetical protein